jgi:2-iminobutanoate/2-iminopropanoate deaminase
LEAAGSSLDQVIRVLIFISDKDEVAAMNKIFARYIKSRPAKTLAVVAYLYGGAKVEMEFTAVASGLS